MRVIDDITNFIFVSDEPEKSDIIFIPGGSWPELAEKAAALWKEGYAYYILPSGKYNLKVGCFPGAKSKKDTYPGEFDTEWDFLRHVLIKCGVDEAAILKENEASENGTYENAFKSRKVTDSMGLDIKKAIICCKPFHARRCLMTYQWAYPDTELLVCPADIKGKGKEDWFNNDEGIKTVMSELKKCGEYFEQAVKVYNTRKI